MGLKVLTSFQHTSYHNLTHCVLVVCQEQFTTITVSVQLFWPHTVFSSNRSLVINIVVFFVQYEQKRCHGSKVCGLKEENVEMI